MKKPYYPLASDSWDVREKLAILKVLDKGHYTMGEEVRKFEKEFADKMNTSEAVMVNSGSSANLIGLASLIYTYDIPPGSEIIVPAISWSTTYFPITQLGMIPVFVDVDSNYNIDPVLVKAAITDKTKVVFAVNLLGMPAQLNKLRRICMERNIHLIEDNCESLGAKLNNQYAGTFGVLGTFSFFFSHHMQTMEGGMIVTNYTKIAEFARSLRAHGWTRDLQTNTIYQKGTDPWKEKFTFITPGYCMRPLEMSGAVGRVQLKKLDRFIERRNKNAEVFKESFPIINNSRQKEFPGAYSSWFGFSCVPETATPPRSVYLHNFAKAGIETRPVVAGNFLKQPVMKYIPHRTYGSFINTETIDRRGFFFGNDHRNLKSKIKRAGEVFYETMHGGLK